ncbi:MAG TPA: lauroyl acyltransferase, partial [Desulfobulbaceae bacterium]|nr:lauroyl acyltransferase [Desulfobulbaceae bacterium]
MKGFWYQVLHTSGRLLGSPLFILVARIIAFTYFCCPGRRRESLRLYGALYPQRSRLYHLWCVFNQFQSFTTIHADRFLTSRGRVPRLTSEGEELLARSPSGAILLMSHLGNWEMAAQML